MAGLNKEGAASSLAEKRRRRQELLGKEPATTQGDSTGITLQVAAIAPHPRNREDLGSRESLQELADSLTKMKEATGNPFLEVPTVTTREAHLNVWPEHVDQIGDATHVLVFGHRRIAAARIAGLETVPVKVRNELAGRDLQTMLIENLHRKDYTPLEEARLFDDLRRRGLVQRDIAKEASKSQSHVAKRLKLLTLPQAIQDAISLGLIPVIDALTLEALGDRDLVLEAWELVSDENSDEATAEEAVAAVRRRVARPSAESRARAEGINLVEAGDAAETEGELPRWLDDPAAIEQAREDGTLAASLDDRGKYRYVAFRAQVKPEVPKARASGTGATDPVPINTARAEACTRLVTAEGELDDVLARTIGVLLDGARLAAARPLAREWLTAAGVIDGSADPAELVRTGTATRDTMTKILLATATAVEEVHTRRCGSEPDARAIAHIVRLMHTVGYEPTTAERARLTSTHS